jgi:hypothetical protein
MAKLDPSAAGRTLFAPIVFRLAMKLEQVSWSEFAGDPTEAVYALRAAQRLFRQDVVVAWFDTWLEAEAAGTSVKRDELGRVLGAPQPPASRPRVADVMAASPAQQAVEIVRRLNVEIGLSQIPVAMLTAGATLMARLGGRARDTVDYATELSVALTRDYCEAGAGALLLVEEEDSPDLADVGAFAALFNLARYYDTPVILVSRHPLSPQGLATASSISGGLYVTPTQAGAAVLPLPEASTPANARARLALSRWEVEAETAPETIQAWRHAVAPA